MTTSNTTNANSDFHRFNTCDYRLHWSWSMLFKNIFICEQIQGCKYIAEFGAADSHLDSMLKHNFKSDYQLYLKYDIMSYPGVAQCDVTDGVPLKTQTMDAIVCSEMIEHVPQADVPYVLNEFYRVLTEDGKLMLTTPSPTAATGDLVWPTSHEFEFTKKELDKLLYNAGFKIEHYMPWYVKGYEPRSNDLIGKLPNGFIKAIESLQISEMHANQGAYTLTKK